MVRNEMNIKRLYLENVFHTISTINTLYIYNSIKLLSLK